MVASLPKRFPIAVRPECVLANQINVCFWIERAGFGKKRQDWHPEIAPSLESLRTRGGQELFGEGRPRHALETRLARGAGRHHRDETTLPFPARAAPAAPRQQPRVNTQKNLLL